ncbi:T9SS type A sorting domain-containing protein [Gelidibacter salicanalis]|uniref:T9SS type A sorting domain-containing protein n=1 Tax=Gelidibacter salicanalis TaxID=291193 RepID=A0A5C7AMS5_9FLAO|nr:T9SS type A sorting domain-containing protein [Gelidibacter salicanalis]TXE09254.1 T9SS type A sorting domain-containing protein [Gelidibacter salicanalis]
MAKLYILLLTLFTWQLGTAQSDVAAIRIPANTTVTAVGVSAIPLVRGSGISKPSTQTNIGFISNGFDSATLNEAITNNDYIEWQVSANSNTTVDIDRVNLSISRQNKNASTKFTVRYTTTNNWSIGVNSFGEKTHGGTTVNEIFELVAPTAITLSAGTTLTFRLYAYGGSTNQRYGIGQLAEGSSALTSDRIGILMKGTVTSEFPTLSYTNGVWSPSAPSSITANNPVSINSGTYTIGANNGALDIVVKELRTASGTKVVIPANGSLTIAGTVFINNGSVELNSTSTNYSSLIYKGAIYEGGVNSVVYKRHVNSYANNNDLISPILEGQNFELFRANNTNIQPLANSTLLFGPFNKDTGKYETWSTTGNTVLDPVTGYRAASTDNAPFIFVGKPVLGDITKDLRHSSAYARWNLVGNPYTAYINAKEFLELNGAVLSDSEVAIYGYDGNASDGWVTWNLNNVTNNVAPGQGFFISVPTGGGQIKFTTSMRRIANTDDFIQNKNANTNSAHAAIQISSDSRMFTTEFYFNDHSTKSLDRGYDAAIYNRKAPNFAIFSHLVENNAGLDMAIQSLAYADLDSEVSIPLGINATKGQQVTVSLHKNELPEGTEVYLEDNVANIFTPLHSADYTFSAQTNITTIGRFFLTFKRTTLSVDPEIKSGLHLYVSDKIVVVKGILEDATLANVYDIQGRVVKTVHLKGQTNSNDINLSQADAGMYIVKLSNRTQEKTQKIILR